MAYLNSAYMGLLPKESVLRGSQGFELKSKSWNIHWEDFYIRPENTRKLFSKLIDKEMILICLVLSSLQVEEKVKPT